MDFNTTGTEQECPLWKAFRSGSADALAKIFNEHYDSLYYYGRKLANDDDLVKDCVQNLFLKMWTARDRLMAVRSIRPYLLKALRRHIGDQIVSKNRKNVLHSLAAEDFPVTFSHEDFLISVQVARHQSDTLVQCLNALSPRKREAIFLRFYEGLDYPRIAEVMSLNVQSVRNLIHQSLQTIKERMNVSPFPAFMNVESDNQ